MSSWTESSGAIGAVDEVLAAVGLTHGRRATRQGSWKQGERVKEPRRSNEQKALRGRKSAASVIRIDAWRNYSWLRAGFSTRLGGLSTAYGKGDLNLGWTAADSSETVARNRQRFFRSTTGSQRVELAAVRQFHSNLIRTVDASHGPLETADGKAVLRGDAVITDLPRLLLGVQTADCVPVLVADTKRRVVAAFHAGWRGTLSRIVERGIGDLVLRYGSKTEDIVAAIGPCIGSCCFAVGEEVRFDFESQFEYSDALFSEVYDSDPVREKYPLLFLTARAPGHSNIGPQIHLDLVEANRRQLLAAGVSARNITAVGECTACTYVKSGSRKYFSHRGEQGFTGRMLSVIGITTEKVEA